MSGHTPGEWKLSAPPVADNGNPWTVRDTDGFAIAICPLPPREANARLIAAAPDGLEAARFALSVLESHPIQMSEQMAIELLTAFISKAEGHKS